jgi:hypothetical protein
VILDSHVTLAAVIRSTVLVSHPVVAEMEKPDVGIGNDTTVVGIWTVLGVVSFDPTSNQSAVRPAGRLAVPPVVPLTAVSCYKPFNC